MEYAENEVKPVGYLSQGMAGVFSYLLCIGAGYLYSDAGGGMISIILICAGVIISFKWNHLRIKDVFIGPLVVLVTVAVLGTRSVSLVEKGGNPEYLKLILDFTGSVIVSCSLFFLFFREKTSHGLSVFNCYSMLLVFCTAAVHPEALPGAEIPGVLTVIFFIAAFFINRQIILEHFHRKKAAGREFVSGVVSGSPFLAYAILIILSISVTVGGGGLLYIMFRGYMDSEEEAHVNRDLVLRKENTHDLRNNQPDINNTRYKMIVRVEYPGNPLDGLYMKGRDYDLYPADGVWRITRRQIRVKTPRTGVIEIPEFHSRRDRYRKVEQYVKLLLLESTEIFCLEQPAFFMMPGADDCLMFYYGSLSFSEISTDIAEYRVQSFLSLDARGHSAVLSETSFESSKYMQFPDHLERVRRLSLDITGKSGSIQSRIKKIKDYLSDGYVYTTDRVYIPPDKDPVEYFLFTGKTGVCVHFASAFVLMARASGIPARYCTGYFKRFPDSGNYDQTSDGMPHNSELYLIQKRNAHAWAEVYIQDAGWMTVEAVPSSVIAELGHPVENTNPLSTPEADTNVSTGGGEEEESKSIFRKAAETVVGFLDSIPVDSFRGWAFTAGVILLGLVFLMKIPSAAYKRFFERVGLSKKVITGIQFFNEFLLILEKRNIRIRRGETVHEFIRRVESLTEADELAFIASEYTALRFGGKTLSDPDRIQRIFTKLKQIENRAEI